MGLRPLLREVQIAAQTNGVGMSVATWLIREKIAASRGTLMALPRSLRTDESLLKLDALLAPLHKQPPDDLQELLLLEARPAFAYVAGWRSLPIRWKGTNRKPIPPEGRRMPLRQSLLGTEPQLEPSRSQSAESWLPSARE